MSRSASVPQGPQPTGIRAIGHSVRGAGHVRHGQPNQDAWIVSERLGAAVAAVSDGHGGARHWRSARGAELAVEVAAQVLHEAAPSLARGSAKDCAEQAARWVPARLVAAWRARVGAELSQDPVRIDELDLVVEAEGEDARATVSADPVLAYGATLLVALRLPQRLVLFQLGDGDIVMVDPQGQASRPVADDQRLAGNLTTSLCRAGAADDFRCKVIDQSAADCPLLMLSTDGYANSFADDAGFLQVGTDFRRLIDEHGIEAVAQQLPAILAHVSENGSGDDVTLAMMVALPRTELEGSVGLPPFPAGPRVSGEGSDGQTRDTGSAAGVPGPSKHNARGEPATAGGTASPAAPEGRARLARQRLLAVCLLLAALAGIAWTQRHRLEPPAQAGAPPPTVTGDGKGIQWPADPGGRSEPPPSSKDAPVITPSLPASAPAKPASAGPKKAGKDTGKDSSPHRDGSWPDKPGAPAAQPTARPARPAASAPSAPVVIRPGTDAPPARSPAAGSPQPAPAVESDPSLPLSPRPFQPR